MRKLRLVHSNIRLEHATALGHKSDVFDPVLQRLLACARIVVPLPLAVRARALARARAHFR